MSTLNHNRKLLLDNFGGMKEAIFCDHDHGADMLIKTAQECDPIVEHNKILADEPPKGDFRLVARVPIIFVDQAMREGWFNDDKKWREFLNNPEYAAFRVWHGRV